MTMTAEKYSAEDLPRLKSLLAEKSANLTDHAKAFKIEDGGGVVVDPEVRDSYRKGLAEALELQGLVKDLESAAALGEWAKSPQNPSIALRQAAQDGIPVHTAKTLGEMFTDSEEFKNLQKSGGGTMNVPWQIEGVDLGSMWGGLGRKDVYTTLPTGPSTAPGFGGTTREPLLELPRRTQRVRDLFPARGTNSNLIEFYRITGFTNNASVVPERSGAAFALKPQSGFAFELTQSPIRTIAHWEVAHRNVLSDEPDLQGIINTELLYGLRLHEDWQILNGSGTGVDLLGILNTPGVQSRARTAVAGDTNIDAIRRAITLIELALYEATGVVVHPINWETMELTKAAGTGAYMLAGSVAAGAERRVWQLPVVSSPAMTANTALVGAFGLAAQLYDRQQGAIRIAEEHADLFLRNAVVILAEERVGLVVRRPESFCKVTALN